MACYVDFLSDDIEITAHQGEEYAVLSVVETTGKDRASVKLFMKDRALAEALAAAFREHKSKKAVVPAIPVITVVDFEKLMEG